MSNASITVRNPFQVYKSYGHAGTVSDFNSLAPEESLPYKVESGEEVLVATLAYIEANPTDAEKYAVCALHAAGTYLSSLTAYLPLMSRSTTVKQTSVNYDVIVRTVMLYAKDMDMFHKVKGLVVSNKPGEQPSITAISEIESCVTALEKLYRQKMKDAGEKVEMLRRVVPSERRPTPSPSVHLSRETSQLEAPHPTEESGATKGTPGKKRSRTRTPSASSQGKKQEGDAAAVTEDGTAAASKTIKTERRTSSRKKNPFALMARLRALTLGEKKAVTVLEQIIEILACVYANRYNDLLPVFDNLMEKVKLVQEIMVCERQAFEEKEDKKPPEPFHETTIEPLIQALRASTSTFRDDDDCRIELDEDLIHPIAHACVTIINQIEGYNTAPFVPPTEEELKKKREARDAIKAKRDEAQQKILERARLKEELAQKKEEEKRLLKQQLAGIVIDEEELQEDTTLVHPTSLGYVQYTKDLPITDAKLFERALYVWSMIVSVPKPLTLSQMPFHMFLRGLLEDHEDANGLMEEVTRCLLEVTIEHVRSSVPNSPKITTRGRSWFSALAEFVAVASGNKKQRPQARKAKEVSSEDFDSDDDDSSDSSSSSSSSSSLEEEEEEEEEEKEDDKENKEEKDKPKTVETEQEKENAAPAEPEISGFEKDIKRTMEHIAELHTMASWGNVDLDDRLNLLQFCVQEALASEVVLDDVDRLSKEEDEDKVTLEKKLREIKDEAEKEIKSLLRSVPSTSAAATGRGKKEATDRADADGGDANAKAADEYEQNRNKILATAEKKRAKAYQQFYQKRDSAVDGAIIRPLGMDRYKRLYWRFPMDRDICVQSTEQSSMDFPLLPMPSELLTNHPAFLFDDEEEEAENKNKKKAALDAAAQTNQKMWGKIPLDYLPTFVKTLDPRGEREARLHLELQQILPYLQTIEVPQEGARVTRARAYTFGYVNTLKSFF